jgi:pyruvate, water dikinase
MKGAPPLVVPLPEARDPARFGPKAANLAALAAAGLPTPGGFCVAAEAYRAQMAHLGLHEAARLASSAEPPAARQSALRIRLALLEQPVAPDVLPPLLGAWRAVAAGGARAAVRSSSLVEDRAGSSFAGQFESYLGVASEADFVTAVRACWAALWSVRALRHLATQGIDPADTTMAVIVQPLVEARAAGGGLSHAPDGAMVVTAANGLGAAIAQGEVVPERYTVGRDGALRAFEPGRGAHRATCEHGGGDRLRPSTTPRYAQGERTRSAIGRCLSDADLATLSRMLLAAESVVAGPAEIEWAADAAGPKLLQARPLAVEAPPVPDAVWARHPRLAGQPAGIGWGTGRARVVSCECELERVAPGDVLVTRVAGPSLATVLPRVSAVVSELGGSTSHLASLARERRIPMVLGVADATARIPDGAEVAVDGVAGLVRWAARP